MKEFTKIPSYFILILTCVLLCTQCKEDSPIQREIDLKHDEIMLIHDEVMPKMKDIYRLKKELKKVKNKEVTNTHIRALDNADEAMMDWMANYKKPGAKDVGYLDYLANQLRLVKEVKIEMLEAISTAQNLLKQ